MIATPLKVPHAPQENDAVLFRRLGSPIGGYTSVTPVINYNGKTYLGTMDTEGNVAVAQYVEATGAFTVSPAIQTGGPTNWTDWHDAPGLLVRSSDKKIIAAFSKHGGTNMYVAVSSSAESVSAWGAPTDITSQLGAPQNTNMTYPVLVQLSGESGKIYMVWRYFDHITNTSAWYFSTSTDGGATWATGKAAWQCDTGKGGYFVLDSDGVSRIDFNGADDVGNLAAASCYHFYYSGGNFRKSDGTLIGSASTTPATPSNATKIYDSANGYVIQPVSIVTNGSTPRCIIWCLNPLDNPSPAAPTFPANFWYAECSGGTWTPCIVTNDGQPISFSPNGLGNACPDAGIPGVVWVAKFTQNVWRYVTTDGGATWTATQITNDNIPANVNTYIEPVRGVLGSTPTVKALWLYGSAINTVSPATYNAFPQTWEVRGYPARA